MIALSEIWLNSKFYVVNRTTAGGVLTAYRNPMHLCIVDTSGFDLQFNLIHFLTIRYSFGYKVFYILVLYMVDKLRINEFDLFFEYLEYPDLFHKTFILWGDFIISIFIDRFMSGKIGNCAELSRFLQLETIKSYF